MNIEFHDLAKELDRLREENARLKELLQTAGQRLCSRTLPKALTSYHSVMVPLAQKRAKRMLEILKHKFSNYEKNNKLG